MAYETLTFRPSKENSELLAQAKNYLIFLNNNNYEIRIIYKDKCDKRK